MGKKKDFCRAVQTKKRVFVEITISSFMPVYSDVYPSIHASVTKKAKQKS